MTSELQTGLAAFFARTDLTGASAAESRALAAAAMAPVLRKIFPPGVVLPFYLTSGQVTANFTSGLGNTGSDYEGWAIVNGSNGTTVNLTGKFPRFLTTGAGGTGGSDAVAHTHPIDHNHAAFNSAAGGVHSHGAGSLATQIHGAGGGTDKTYARFASAGANWTSNYSAAGDAWTGDAGYTGNERILVDGTTADESSHVHSVNVPSITATSGAASDTENRPAYLELVPLMRVS